MLAFFRGLLRERKGIFFWLIVLNALAAGTALVVPGCWATWSTAPSTGGAEAAQLSSLDHARAA